MKKTLNTRQLVCNNCGETGVVVEKSICYHHDIDVALTEGGDVLDIDVDDCGFFLSLEDRYLCRECLEEVDLSESIKLTLKAIADMN